MKKRKINISQKIQDNLFDPLYRQWAMEESKPSFEMADRLMILDELHTAITFILLSRHDDEKENNKPDYTR